MKHMSRQIFASFLNPPRKNRQTESPIRRGGLAYNITHVPKTEFLESILQQLFPEQLKARLQEEWRNVTRSLITPYTRYLTSLPRRAQNVSENFLSSIDTVRGNITDKMKADLRRAFDTLSVIGNDPGEFVLQAVSYTHLTLPTIYSV